MYGPPGSTSSMRPSRSSDDARLRGPRGEPRRPRGVDPARGPADRRAAALADLRDRAVGRDRAARLPQRRGGAGDRRRSPTASRPAARGGAGARTGARRGALGAAHDRSRPAPVRFRDVRHRRAHAAPSSAPRAAFCARAARRAGARPRRPGAGGGGGFVVEATISAMSHIDELDDYEAELELRLKREYSAVYSLFRYCVLAQDGTYLCNKLDLQYVPQPAYPFFEVKME